jgi:putative effector of murein hydrolase LrgA (UPF0299 family)
MLVTIAILLSCQLAGEVFARALALPVPGPVVGLVILFLACTLRPTLAERVGPVARGFLGYLSLLFVPAGVGVVANLGILAQNGAAMAVVVMASTVIAMLVSVGTFLALHRLTGARND